MACINKERRLLILFKGFIAIILGTFTAWLVFIVFSTPVEGLSKNQENAITQNCSTIKQTLSQLQKVDSRTRTYLGTTYEMVLNRFLVPLNLRLVKNNRPTLPEIQSQFTNKQGDFRSKYTEYMRELENLIGLDCQSHPEDFYHKLEVVRKRRSELHDITEELSVLAENLYNSVVKLKDSL